MSCKGGFAINYVRCSFYNDKSGTEKANSEYEKQDEYQNSKSFMYQSSIPSSFILFLKSEKSIM